MTRLGTRPQAAPLRNASGTVGKVAGLAIVIVMLFLGSSLLALPRLVPNLTVVNPGVYQVNVEISAAGHDEWSDQGTLDRESTKTIEEIVDEGSTWVFRFSYARVPAGDLVVSRSRLVSDGWRITVPSEVAERLGAAGLQPSAR